MASKVSLSVAATVFYCKSALAILAWICNGNRVVRKGIPALNVKKNLTRLVSHFVCFCFLAGACRRTRRQRRKRPQRTRPKAEKYPKQKNPNQIKETIPKRGPSRKKPHLLAMMTRMREHPQPSNPTILPRPRLLAMTKIVASMLET